MARRRAWSPPARSAHIFNPVPSLAQYADAPEPGRWSTNPNAHAAIFKPKCTVAGCREDAMIWHRHGCKTMLARCHAHDPTDPLVHARAQHEATCAQSISS